MTSLVSSNWRSLEILRRNLWTSCKQTYKDKKQDRAKGHFHRSDMTCFIAPRSCRKVAASALTPVPSDRIPSYKRPRNELTVSLDRCTLNCWAISTPMTTNSLQLPRRWRWKHHTSRLTQSTHCSSHLPANRPCASARASTEQWKAIACAFLHHSHSIECIYGRGRFGKDTVCECRISTNYIFLIFAF